MRVSFIWTMIVCMTVLPTASATADSTNRQTEPVQLQNVQLSANGTAAGQLLNDAGQPLAGQLVKIQTKTGLQKITTNKDGRFTLGSKSGGNCVITVAKRSYACRLWQNNTAPPKSLTSFSIVHGNGPILRAQDCGEGCDDGYGGRSGRPGGITGGQVLGLALLAGAVVAIVIAVENDGDGS